MNNIKQLLLLGGVFFLFAACQGKRGLFTGGDEHVDWPVFRGNTALSGYTEAILPENPVCLWTYRSEERTSSSPVVYDDIAYWVDKKGHILGIDIRGQLAFDYDLQTAVEATPAICDSVLYIGRIDGNMTALSLLQKKILWNYETIGQISASPNFMRFGGRDAVLFGSYDNHLYCLAAADGQLIGRYPTGYYLNGAVALSGEYVLFGGCDSWLRVIHAPTGMLTDSLRLDAYIPASPAVSGNECYVSDYSGNGYELKLDKGKIAHQKKFIVATDKEGSHVSVPAVAPKVVYTYAGRYVCAIDRKDNKIRWKYMLKGDTGESSPVVCDDKLIVCTKTGVVSILNTEQGTLEWEYDAGEQIIGSPAVIENHFFILTAKGTLLCFGNSQK